MITSLLEKDDHIKRLNEKMSKLSTKDLQKLQKKVAKRISQYVQTDELKETTPVSDSFSIWDKLPKMDRKTVREKNVKVGRFLNINTARGEKDRCFNCLDLEKKINELKRTCSQLKKEIVEYQEKSGKIDVDMTRGKQDRCFNCIDLEKKIKDEKNNRGGWGYLGCGAIRVYFTKSMMTTFWQMI